MGTDIEDPWMLLLEEDMVGAIGLHALLRGRERELLALVVAPLLCHPSITTHFVIFVTDNQSKLRDYVECSRGIMLNAGCRAEEIDSERERERDRSAPTIDVRVREGILGSAEGDVRRAVEQPEERTLRQQPVVHLVEPAATIAYDFLVQVPTKGSVLL